MPYNDYKCNECDHTWEEKQSVDSRNVPRYNPCPNCGSSGDISLVITSVNIGDSWQLGVKKPDPTFVNRLKQIEDTYSKPAGQELKSRYTQNLSEV